MESLTDYRAHRRLPDLPLAAASILGFWLFYFTTIVIRTWLIEESLAWLGSRALGCLIGMVLTFLVYLVLSRAARESVRIQIVAAAIACVPAAAIFSTFNLAFAVHQPLVERTDVRHTADGTTVIRSSRGAEVRIGKGGTPVVLPGSPQGETQRQRRLQDARRQHRDRPHSVEGAVERMRWRPIARRRRLPFRRRGRRIANANVSKTDLAFASK